MTSVITSRNKACMPNVVVRLYVKYNSIYTLRKQDGCEERMPEQMISRHTFISKVAYVQLHIYLILIPQVTATAHHVTTATASTCQHVILLQLQHTSTRYVTTATAHVNTLCCYSYSACQHVVTTATAHVNTLLPQLQHMSTRCYHSHSTC